MQIIELKISRNDLLFIQQFGDSDDAESVKYEIAEMYRITIDEIEYALKNLDSSRVAKFAKSNCPE